MRLIVSHRTTFVYAGKAHDSFNEVRLHPLNDETQQCCSFELQVTPEAESRSHDDFYGNTVHYFEVIEGHRKLIVDATSVVETTPVAARGTVPIVTVGELESSPEREMLAEFCGPSHYIPLDDDIRHETEDALGGKRTDVWNDVRRLGEHVHKGIKYLPKTTGVTTLATDVIRLRTGVCQDFAHVHVGLCRTLGIPARYVSGYFLNTARRPREIEASHAWMEAWIPGFGWSQFDPTHARAADERYVKVAVGRDYADIRPISGTYRGAPTRSMRVDVTVREASDEGPR